ncbi:Calx-beta domain-containing protein [Bdellovibrio bacteriovorus]|uniref:Calx-beta domain-containing protein n=1 Tax=Bdellovibrio bacteriovorus TaxID=959 RepID=UPI003AA8B568
MSYQNVIRIFTSVFLMWAVAGCGNLSAEMFGKVGSILNPSLPGPAPLQYPKILKVDADTTGASSVSTLALPRYTTAGIVPIQVHFSGPVNVTGNPTIELETGATKRLATYASGSGTSMLVFEYAVVAGDSALTLDYTGTQAINLNGGSIEPAEDVTGTADEVANLLTLPAPGAAESLSQSTPVLIRTIPEVKRLSTPDTDVYLDGTSLEVIVKYDQPVTVTGNPRITIRIGSNNRIANYVTKVSPSELLFRYEVVVGDDDTDGIEMPAAIELNGATVTNPANEVAVTDLPVKDTTGILTYTSALTASFVSSSQIVNEDAGTLNIPVVLSAPAPIAFKVTIAVMGDAGAEDFTLTSKEVNFAVGETTKYIPLTILDDAVAEPEKRIRLILAKNSLGNGGMLSVHEVLIRDDDSAVVAPKVVSFKQGVGFACALYDNNDLKCFGTNDYGQLGNGTVVNTNEPSATPVMQNVAHFEVGGYTVCAANTSGEMWCWGRDNASALPGSVGGKVLQPTKYVNSGVTQVAVSSNVLCYLKTNKDLMCWGDDYSGIFGTGSTNASRTLAAPQLVTGQVEEMRLIAAVTGNTLCAVKLDSVTPSQRNLFCWGNRSTWYSSGSTSTVPATPLATNIVSYDLFNDNICVQKDEGAPTVRKNYCWGNGSNGQLTPGTSGAGSTVPVEMSSEYKDMMTSQESIIALKNDGSVWTWGSGGRIPGGNPIVAASAPVQLISGGVKNLLRMSNRYGPTDGLDPRCVLMLDSSVQCWMASPLPVNKTLPVTVIPTGVESVSVSNVFHENYYSACSLMSSGEVLCWGQNSVGQVGDRTLLPRLVPTQALSRNQRQIATGRERSCSVSTYGELRCWGYNSANLSLGVSPAFTSFKTPKIVIGKDVSKVALNDDGGCALLTTGGLNCWGDNNSGQSKPGSASINTLPNLVLSSGVRDVETSYQAACYIATNDDLFCWGDNTQKQLGLGDTIDRTTIPATPLLSGVDSVSMGGHETSPGSCAVMKNGDLKCWGSGLACMGTNSDTPTTLLTDVKKVSVGRSHMCAIVGDERRLVCWGQNPKGQLGIGTTVDKCYSSGPATVVAEGVRAVSAGSDSTCFVLETGEMKCMGDNNKGVVGTADRFPFPRTVWGL